MQQRIAGVVYDNDGVLNRVEELRNGFWPVAAERCGYSGHSREEFLCTLGRNSTAVVEEVRKVLCPDLSLEQGTAEAQRVRTLRNQLVDAHLEANGLEAKPGARESLELLAELQIPVSMYSSSNGETVRRLLELTGLREFFPDSRLVTGDLVKNGKPAPDGFIRAAELIRVDPRECAGVEDAQAGSDALTAAGMYSIRIPDLEGITVAGFRSVDVAFPTIVSMNRWLRTLPRDPSANALLLER
jgi:HAD superfamily hydrolase (TIGR01509 family)